MAMKPWYAERPSDELVSEIKAFIKETGTPHLWPGHTHTKPPAGAVIRYRGEFDLPANRAGLENKAKWAPCPCCKPKSPWYYKGGKIAWFPEEKAIRNIGRDCFKAIDAKGHAEAEELFRVEENRRRTENYLLGHLALVPEILRAVSANLPLVEDVDRVRQILSRRLGPAIGFDLWNDVRFDGSLRIEVERTEQRVDRAGNQSEHTVREFKRYGPLSGYAMLDPGAKPMGARIEKLAAKLAPLDFGDRHAEHLARMDDSDRAKAVKALRSAADIGDVFAEAEDVRTFLSPMSLGSLNGWARTEGAAARIYIALSQDRTQLFLGKTEDDARPLIFRPTFFNNLVKLPAISKSIRDIQ